MTSTTNRLDHPLGQTCSDCKHFKKTCSWLLSYTGKEKKCDWIPSRFVPIALGVKSN